jgi:serine/threonine protein kinase
VKSFGWFEDPSSIFIAMEYCRHGDLHHYLIDQGVVPAGEVQPLTYQILEGLGFRVEINYTPGLSNRSAAYAQGLTISLGSIGNQPRIPELQKIQLEADRTLE